MSKKIEKMLEHMTPAQAAKFMQTVNDISSAARREFNIDVPLDDIAELIQVREAVFHGTLDRQDLENALYNLKENSAAVRDHLANAESVKEAAMLGADTSSGKLDGDTLMSIKSPARRMALARKHGAELPKADRGDRRPGEQYAVKDYPSIAATVEDAIRRMNEARGIK